MVVSEKKKIKYDAAYISYVNNGESAAVFITRDIAANVPTAGKWIDVIEMDTKGRRDDRWDFNYFIVELFPRKTKPVYPPDAYDEEKKYITWQTAHKDIADLRSRGYHGPRYKVVPKLVNRHKGKYYTKTAAWNKTFEQWVPDKWFNSSCEWREKKIPVKPKWEYEIVSLKKL